jgi:hypothetical protein
MRKFGFPTFIMRTALLISALAIVFLPMGCGIINPRLLGTIGGNPASAINPIEGHIAILLMNNSDTFVQVEMDIADREEPNQLFLGAEANDYIVATKPCDNLISIDIQIYRYNLDGESTEESANLGTLELGDAIFCGEVIAITVTGTPPDFSVEIY